MPEQSIDIACGETLGLVLTKSGFVYEISLNAAELKATKNRALETEFVTKIAANRSYAAVTDDGIL